MTTFAIVPGLWQDSRAWFDCARQLRLRGHSADVIALTGHGRQADWMVSHRDCVDSVIAHIRSNNLRNLTLVGHSASAPLTIEAAIKLGPKYIERVVLSSPLLPPFPGMSVLDTLPTSLRKHLVENSLKATHGNRFTPTLPFDLFLEFFANGVSFEFAKWFFAHYLCPQPSLRLVAGLDLRPLAETKVAVSVLEVKDDPLCWENNEVVTAREALIAMGVESARIEVSRIGGGGLAFLAHPQAFADALEACTEVTPLAGQSVRASPPREPMHHA